MSLTYRVYVITCLPTGKQYVGMTYNALAARFGKHVVSAFDPNKNFCRLLGDAIREHGREAFRIELLRETACKEKALMLEARYATELRTLAPNGYNLSAGNHRVMSEEVRGKWLKAIAKNGQHPDVMRAGTLRMHADPIRSAARAKKISESLLARSARRKGTN